MHRRVRRDRGVVEFEHLRENVLRETENAIVVHSEHNNEHGFLAIAALHSHDLALPPLGRGDLREHIRVHHTIHERDSEVRHEAAETVNHFRAARIEAQLALHEETKRGRGPAQRQ